MLHRLYMKRIDHQSIGAMFTFQLDKTSMLYNSTGIFESITNFTKQKVNTELIITYSGRKKFSTYIFLNVKAWEVFILLLLKYTEDVEVESRWPVEETPHIIFMLFKTAALTTNVLFVVAVTPVNCIVRMYDSPCAHACKDTLCGVKKTNSRSILKHFPSYSNQLFLANSRPETHAFIVVHVR